MNAVETPIQLETELERIESWRLEELGRAGYSSAAASMLATRHDVDLHHAVELRLAGCPEDIALRILL